MSTPDLWPGQAPIFALPNTVFFPGTRLPLHIFEPRYREMTRRALETDRLIAVALLRPGWEETYEGNPPIHEVATVGKIIFDQEVPGGRYNIVLEGIARFRPETLVQETPYRIARGSLLYDVVDPWSQESIRSSALHLAAILSRIADEDVDYLPALGHAAAANLPPGRLADLVAAALDMELAAKQLLLDSLDVEMRLKALLAATTQKLDQILERKRRDQGHGGPQWN